MKIALIGNGAIAEFVMAQAKDHGFEVAAQVLRPTRIEALRAQGIETPQLVCAIADLPQEIDLVVDCAGHEALRTYGPDVLRAGLSCLTVSIGALADDALKEQLENAARQGQAHLYLASGAIGALDCLSSAHIGTLKEVRYTGRKPPLGWAGSPAEDSIDLAKMTTGEKTHFQGSARQAALRYPKNANVAAAVALAGVGFDNTQVTLIADATVSSNVHEVQAIGDFGSFDFQIAGNTLPGNPRTSALAAMSVVAKIVTLSTPIQI